MNVFLLRVRFCKDETIPDFHISFRFLQIAFVYNNFMYAIANTVNPKVQRHAKIHFN